jgi:hypothetical protein
MSEKKRIGLKPLKNNIIEKEEYRAAYFINLHTVNNMLFDGSRNGEEILLMYTNEHSKYQGRVVGRSRINGNLIVLLYNNFIRKDNQTPLLFLHNNSNYLVYKIEPLEMQQLIAE